jgi:Clp amino terminal domain, pathogenicity island component
MTLDELISDVEGRTSEATPLERLASAAALSDRLDELADHLLGHFVDQARQGGASWAQVGSHLGVTKQAAQKRFVVGEPSLDAFTNRAAIVVLKAQNTARDRGAEEVTTQHLVLGLLAEWPGIAGQALEALGVRPDALATAIEATLPAPAAATAAHRPFAAGLRRTLELARRRGLRLGHVYVGTEHLLLGLVDAADQPTVAVLASMASGDNLVADVEASVRAALDEWHDARPGS